MISSSQQQFDKPSAHALSTGICSEHGEIEVGGLALATSPFAQDPELLHRRKAKLAKAFLLDPAPSKIEPKGEIGEEVAPIESKGFTIKCLGVAWIRLTARLGNPGFEYRNVEPVSEPAAQEESIAIVTHETRVSPSQKIRLKTATQVIDSAIQIVESRQIAKVGPHRLDHNVPVNGTPPLKREKS
jgi:hypothetical protein